MYPTNNKKLLDWVVEVAKLCQPRSIYFCDGSSEEFDSLTRLLVEKGTLEKLSQNKRPNSFLARSNPADTARVEDRTFVCCDLKDHAGPTNNWVDPIEMKKTMTELFSSCMEGRTLYVIPFVMGPIESPLARFGVQLSDSPYVVVNMAIMTRMGSSVLDALGKDGEFTHCLHSVGYPLKNGKKDVSWPCDPAHIYVSHFPDSDEIWSYGSGYGGNALLGKKCMALRIASTIARRQGWFAEHMLLMKVTSPKNEVHYIAGAFPSACGKTNLAMMTPSLPNWKVETLGDDICWIRVGKDGRLYAMNPETGLFGVAAGTNYRTNSNAMSAIAHGTIFTNTARTKEGDVWWETLVEQSPDNIIDWHGVGLEASDYKGLTSASHANARFTTRIDQLPNLAPEWDDPEGVPLSAIIFGGRRSNLVPLVSEATSWSHGVFLGATMASETTAAATGTLGELRRDPFAMLPFCGYHIADYFSHWLDLQNLDGVQLPKMFLVNWFRKGSDGKFLWPGFSENIRVIEWIVDRISGRATGLDCAYGLAPKASEFNVGGLGLDDETLETLLAPEESLILEEAAQIDRYFGWLGDRVPQSLRDQLDIFARKI